MAFSTIISIVIAVAVVGTTATFAQKWIRKAQAGTSEKSDSGKKLS